MTRALSLALVLVATPALAKPPRLTLFIAVDALGTDLLLRSRPQLKAGLANLIDRGAFYPDVRYEQAQVATAPGHSVLSTGAYPWRTGVVGNRVMNRTNGKDEPVFWDPTHPVLDAPAGVEDVSPEPMLAETLADHLRLFTSGRGKAIVLSGKARAAIALAGRLGQAFWFNEQVGRLVTGTAYMKELPAWLRAFNDKRIPDAAFSTDWSLALPVTQYLGDDDRPFESPQYGMGRTVPHSLKGGATAPGPPSYAAFASSPFANDLLVQAAKAAITAEGLGKDDVPDFLAVSFSATDLVYHQYGPYSWEMQDALIRLDKQIADLLAAAEKAAGGRQNLLVVVSSDHGGAALPEEWIAAGVNATRVKPSALRHGLGQELQNRFGAPLLVGMVDRDVFLNAKTMAEKKLDPAAVRRAAAEWLGRQPGVALAVSQDDLESGQELSGFLPALRRSHYPGRSGDVTFLLKPYAIFMEGDSGTTHGEPYAYDDQIPLVLYGKNVKPGLYRTRIHASDVAPTAAMLMEMGAPASAEGEPRVESVVQGR
ncbi:MAG TPA: alkaline phosphatase family protein [Myxococcaceae bacterium]|nr:alkaline phosphatase family protein [Myxococcaceae bacterium]